MKPTLVAHFRYHAPLSPLPLQMSSPPLSDGVVGVVGVIGVVVGVVVAGAVGKRTTPPPPPPPPPLEVTE